MGCARSGTNRPVSVVNPSHSPVGFATSFPVQGFANGGGLGGDTIMRVHLTVISGRHRGQTIPVTQSPFLIGRDPAAHLRPASPAIEKQHCAIVVKDGKAMVQDFAKSTRLNERPIEGAAELTDGDCLQVGPLAFRFCIDRTAPALETNPPATTDPEEDAVAALLLSIADQPGQKSVAAYKVSETINDGGWGPTKETPRAAPSELSGTALSAREILRSYRKPRKETEPDKEPDEPRKETEPDKEPGSKASTISKRLEARPLNGLVPMPSIYTITETRPKYVIIHRTSGPRPPKGFKEVHTSVEEATHHLRGLHVGYHVTVTDTGG
jgi:pSer/pThr/pTyr-binding forkhead associated (FHA) protein